MKRDIRKFSIILLVFSLLMLVGCTKQEEPTVTPEPVVEQPAEELVGGWEERVDQEVTEELLNMFKKGVEGTIYEQYVPVKFLATQVVSGMNFKFLCENGEELIIYQDLDRNYFALNPDGSVAEKVLPETIGISITREEALNIALADAGVNEVRFVEISLDREAQKLVYEVDFESGEFEYDYDIDAATGEILWKISELDEEHFVKKDFREAAPDAPASELTDAQVKELALNEAGISASDISFLKIERDIDDGIKEIEVDFIHNNKEYSYKFNSETGELLESEIENLD